MNILKLLRPAPPIAPSFSGPEEMRKNYRYWRTRNMIAIMVGYSLFYFVRKNLSIAMPAIEAELGISKADLGLFLTLNGLIYGVSKFVNGFIGDQTNPRYFMALGLFCSALMSIFFGMSSAVITFGIFWLLNGWFQGMGFPPCANTLTHWFSEKERGTKFAIWNTSHSIGAALVMILNGFLVVYNWRLCFFVPAVLGILGAFFIVQRLRNTPESLGLPVVEKYTGERSLHEKDREELTEIRFKKFIGKKVFGNPLIWIISFANFFLYTIRYVILDWGPTFLTEMKGVNLAQAGWLVAGYEGFGIVGMLLGGWMMDRVFKGRGGRAAFFYMLACTVTVFLFWKLPMNTPFINGLLLCIIGFTIYGPQFLVGVIAANLATKRAAATAIGMTGFFGYLSTLLSGWGLGVIVTKGGWDHAFLTLVIVGGVAAILFAFTWNARYGSELQL